MSEDALLSLLVTLIAAPQTAIPTLPPAPSTEGRAADMPVLGQAPYGCDSRPTQAIQPVLPGNSLMWREGDQTVGLYRLLERRVNGCPAPIIVNYRVPGSNAIGREIIRTPAAPSAGDRLPR